MLNLKHLPGSDLQEHRVSVQRASWITIIPLILSTFLVFIIPFLGYVTIKLFNQQLFAVPWHFTAFILGASLFFLYGLMFCFQTFIDYWLDVFIVTDRRILDIRQSGLFSRTVAELRLYRIQDVTSKIKGFWHTIFSFGDISIQTASEVDHFKFINIPHPNKLAKIILELSEKDRKENIDAAVEEFGMPERNAANVAKKIEP